MPTLVITPAELAADRAAEAAAEALRKFRGANWAYFASTERVGLDGVRLPRVRRENLEREAFRLFEIVREANKQALALERGATK